MKFQFIIIVVVIVVVNVAVAAAARRHGFSKLTSALFVLPVS